MNTTEDVLYEWLRQPIDQLRREIMHEPHQPWQHFSDQLLRDLGLWAIEQHPLIELLYDHLREIHPHDDAGRLEFFKTTEIDDWLQWAIPELAGRWHLFVQTNLPYWDGTEAAWPAFAEWLPRVACAEHLGPMANQLVDLLEPLQIADRARYLAETYQVSLPAGVGAAYGQAGAAYGQTDPSGAGTGHEQYDESAWLVFARENLPLWDGTDAHWRDLSSWFVDTAASRHLEYPARNLVAAMADKSLGERIAELNALEAFDMSAWQHFLSTEVIRWDGTEQSWQPFATWAHYEATGRRLGAMVLSLIEYLGALPVQQRVTELSARYGVPITVGYA